MGIFMSAEQKKMEERILIKRAISNIKKYLDKLNESRDNYIAEAKKAKAQNIPSQYNLAKSGLSMVLSQKLIAEQLLLTMEMSQQMKDTANITQGFAEGMTTLSKEVNRINAQLNLKKTGVTMNKAMLSSQQKSLEMQDFLEESNSAFQDFSADAALGKELDSMIDSEVAMNESELDLKMNKEIDALLGKNR